MQQLPLNIKFDQEILLSNFLVGKNQVLVEYLKQATEQSTGEFIFLWGDEGSGKSHLLQSVANRLSEHQPMYLPLTEMGLAPEMLEGLEQMEWVLIDDVNVVVKDKKWEEALFHLYNRIKDKGGNLMVTSTLPPNELEIHLKDLQSRLAAMTVFKIQSLSDNDKQVLLQQKAASKGMVLGDEVAQFVLSRSSRDLQCLMDSLDKLDKASLIQKRKLTVPFVKEVLGI